MSWGALNNHREKTTTEPLPEFLTGQGSKSFNDRLDPQFQKTEDVIVRKSERQPYTPRQEMNRGYGVSYPGSINIQLSKKTFFVSVVFFVTVVLATFSLGYGVGTLSFSRPAGQKKSNAFTKKPIIPTKQKIKQGVHAEKENIESTSTEINVTEQSLRKMGDVSAGHEESTSRAASEKNNNKENDSETIDDAPKAAADKNDMAN